MNFFVEAAQHSPKSIRNAPDSGNIVPPENQTFMGFVRSLISAIEPWHLNMLAGLLVTTFVYWQFSSMFVARLRPKQQKHESFNTQKPIKKKEFADKQVGDDLDIIDDHDEFQNAKEILYRGPSYPEEEMCKRSQLFYEAMKLRRSVRCFSNKSIPMKIVQNIIKTAGTSPSGANLQPWTFCIVASEHLKTKIREIVETEEQINYSRRMGAKWVLDVEHLNVNWNKPYLTEAPYLIVVMKHTYQILDNGQRQPTYYNEISTCLATGIMLTAIHNAGLVTVVTTPLNAGGQIRNLLQRPPNEKVVMLLPLGYPLENAHVPDIKRKPIEEIVRIY